MVCRGAHFTVRRVDDLAHTLDLDRLLLGGEDDFIAGTCQRRRQVFELPRHVLMDHQDFHRRPFV